MTPFRTLPNSVTRPTTFGPDTDNFFEDLPARMAEEEALAVAMTAVAAGGAVSLQYTFSTTTTDADPGAGTLRLDNATQNTATTIRADLAGSDASDLTGVLGLVANSTSINKGFIKIIHATVPTKWLLFSVSALASPAGYKNITVVCIASSTASPFANGDALLFNFNPVGDSGTFGLGLQTAWIPAGAMVSRNTNGAASGVVEMATTFNMFRTLDFDTAASEYSQFCIQMPKSWNEGTVTAAFVWSHAATTTNFGAAFGLQGVAVGNDDTGAVAFGTGVLAVDTGGTTNDIYISPTTAAITIAGTPAPNDYVMFQVYRAVADAGDTLAIDARLHGVQLFYTVDAATDA